MWCLTAIRAALSFLSLLSYRREMKRLGPQGFLKGYFKPQMMAMMMMMIILEDAKIPPICPSGPSAHPPSPQEYVLLKAHNGVSFQEWFQPVMPPSRRQPAGWMREYKGPVPVSSLGTNWKSYLSTIASVFSIETSREFTLSLCSRFPLPLPYRYYN